MYVYNHVYMYIHTYLQVAANSSCVLRAWHVYCVTTKSPRACTVSLCRATRLFRAPDAQRCLVISHELGLGLRIQQLFEQVSALRCHDPGSSKHCFCDVVKFHQCFPRIAGLLKGLLDHETRSSSSKQPLSAILTPRPFQKSEVGVATDGKTALECFCMNMTCSLRILEPGPY